MKFLVIVIMFFIVGGLFIISNNNLEMYKKENVLTFRDFYFDWINQLFVNAQEITGAIVKLDWFP